MKTCQDLQFDLLAVARRELTDAKVRKAVLKHTEICLFCAQRLANERMLTAELDALKQADAEQVRVPPCLEPALLQEFRRTMVPVPAQKRSGSRRRMAVAAAIAAIVLLVVMTGRLKIKPAPKPVMGPSEMATLPPPLPEKDPMAPTETTRTLPPARVRRFRPPRTVTLAAQQAGEMSSDFFIFPYAPALDAHESAEIYRVRVPRASLTGLGLPPGGRLDEPVEADLVIGPDGVARGIRFIR